MLHSDVFYLTGWSNLQISITVNCRLKSIVYRQYNVEVSEQRHAMSNEKNGLYPAWQSTPVPVYFLLRVLSL